MNRSTMALSGPDLPSATLERERERTIEVLSRHFAHDNLSLDELDRRMEQVYRAASVSALRDLVRDLPDDAADAEQRRAAAVPELFVPEHDRIISIMAETRRRGLWRPARHLDVWCVMADTRLDLTEAQLAPGITEIQLRAVMASTRVTVPPNVRVVLQPTAFMSSVTDDIVDQPPVGSGAPVVRITGLVLMSELKVVVRRRELMP